MRLTLTLRPVPKCGWRYLVVDDKGVTITVWAERSQARRSLAHNGKPGWTVQHEGTRQVLDKH